MRQRADSPSPSLALRLPLLDPTVSSPPASCTAAPRDMLDRSPNPIDKIVTDLPFPLYGTGRGATDHRANRGPGGQGLAGVSPLRQRSRNGAPRRPFDGPGAGYRGRTVQACTARCTGDGARSREGLHGRLNRASSGTLTPGADHHCRSGNRPETELTKRRAGHLRLPAGLRASRPRRRPCSAEITLARRSVGFSLPQKCVLRGTVKTTPSFGAHVRCAPAERGSADRSAAWPLRTCQSGLP